jgi:hypothetical protein
MRTAHFMTCALLVAAAITGLPERLGHAVGLPAGDAYAKEEREGRIPTAARQLFSAIELGVNRAHRDVSQFVIEASSRPAPTMGREPARSSMREGATPSHGTGVATLSHSHGTDAAIRESSPPWPARALTRQPQPNVVKTTAAPSAQPSAQPQSVQPSTRPAAATRQPVAAKEPVTAKEPITAKEPVTRRVFTDIVWEPPANTTTFFSALAIGRLDHVVPAAVRNFSESVAKISVSDALLVFAGLSVAFAAGLGVLKARRAYKDVLYLD